MRANGRSLKEELLRLMAEAVYLGFTESEMSALYRQALDKRREENSHD